MTDDLVSAEEARRLREEATDGPWATSEPRPRWITTAAPIQIDEADWGQPDDCRTYKLVTLDDDRAWSYADTRLTAAAPSLALTVEVQAWRIAELEAAMKRAYRELADEHFPDPERGGHRPVCVTCSPQDGSWPCTSDMIRVDLIAALGFAREAPR